MNTPPSDMISDAVLLLIDLQQGFDEPVWGERNNPELETNVRHLLESWRENECPVIHVHHASTEPDSPFRPDQPGFAFKESLEPRPTEPVFEKTVNSAFIGTDLEEYLHTEGHERLFIVGLTTEHCVSTTARMADNLGFETVIVSDGTATFDRSAHDGSSISAAENHRTALAHLHEEFASIVSTFDVLETKSDM